MIRFRLKDVIARKEYEWNRRIPYAEVAKATGIHRATLSKIANTRGYNTTTDNVAAICRYLGCELHELMELENKHDSMDE
jgi:putative transcriptional regulator